LCQQCVYMSASLSQYPREIPHPQERVQLTENVLRERIDSVGRGSGWAIALRKLPGGVHMRIATPFPAR
jgi:hypothetical protein